MFEYTEISEGEEERIIERAAEIIHEYKMEVPAIMLLESSKPLAYIAGQMGRLYLAPYLPILKQDFNISGEKLLRIFEKRENIEKLIRLLEEKAREESF
jgi:hypothetical protein